MDIKRSTKFWRYC